MKSKADTNPEDARLAQEVSAWTALLNAAEAPDEVGDVFRRLGALGPAGAVLREALLAPVLAKAEREGFIEATGYRARDGQRIYRSRVHKG